MQPSVYTLPQRTCWSTDGEEKATVVAPDELYVLLLLLCVVFVSLAQIFFIVVYFSPVFLVNFFAENYGNTLFR